VNNVCYDVELYDMRDSIFRKENIHVEIVCLESALSKDLINKEVS